MPRLRLLPLESRVVPSIVFETEPNNTAAAANVVTVATGDVIVTSHDDWTTLQGDIAASSDRDFFRFTLTAPAGVFFDVDSRDTGLSANLDAVLDVYNSTGLTNLGTNDDGYDLDAFVAPTVATGQGFSPDSSYYLDLPAGTFVARIVSFSSSTTGTYQLRMLADPTTLSSPPVWHSNPSAAATFVIDADGEAVANEWGTFTAGRFDLDGQPANYTPAERLALWNTWRVVAEDFAPFDVDVTSATASPPSGGTYRVVLTSSAGSIVGTPSNSRSAATLGDYAGAGSNLGFVFQPGFGDYQGGISGQLVATALEIGNATSQVLGTAIGLQHYGGANSQANGIMQYPDTGLNRSTWSAGLSHSGEPPVVYQDDTAIITVGLGLRVDDHGNTIATATPISGTIATGIIADRNTDRDLFQFVAGQGNLTIQVTGDGYTGNIDAELRLFNEAGQLMADDAPSGSTDAGFKAYLPGAASYFIDVRSDGDGGDIGSYRISLSVAPVTGPGQVLADIVNGGANQRSNVNDIAVRFSRPLTFPDGVAAAFTVARSNGTTVPIDIDLSGSTPSQSIAMVRFPNGTGFGSIADGNYTLKVLSAHVLDDDNNQLDGDSNGVAGGDHSFVFFRLFGDSDGDRDVDNLDFRAFRGGFGISAGNPGFQPEFDADGDGDVDNNDFFQFRPRFGTTI